MTSFIDLIFKVVFLLLFLDLLLWTWAWDPINQACVSLFCQSSWSYWHPSQNWSEIQAASLTVFCHYLGCSTVTLQDFTHDEADNFLDSWHYRKYWGCSSISYEHSIHYQSLLPPRHQNLQSCQARWPLVDQVLFLTFLFN